MKRLWISSMEDDAIRAGVENTAHFPPLLLLSKPASEAQMVWNSRIV